MYDLHIELATTYNKVLQADQHPLFLGGFVCCDSFYEPPHLLEKLYITWVISVMMYMYILVDILGHIGNHIQQSI